MNRTHLVSKRILEELEKLLASIFVAASANVLPRSEP
jgi:hypothetical protein